MLNKKALSATAAAVEPTYVEDVFSTYLYTGTGSAQFIQNNIALNTIGEQAFTKPGTYTWICPAEVTSISVVCIGAGGGFGEYDDGTYYYVAGGGGGGLGYKNNVSVTPGTAYTVIVGDSVNINANGQSSEFKLGSTGLVGASGGLAGSGTTAGSGGSPLYSSSGGNGGSGVTTGVESGGITFGSGGSAGGYSSTGATGGGTGSKIYGEGSTTGAAYGAGGNYISNPGTGAVRILWPGNTRQFPSTDVGIGQESNGGMVWIKSRSSSSYGNINAARNPISFFSTFSADNNAYLNFNSTSIYAADNSVIPYMAGNGFQVGTNSQVNASNVHYGSWTFKNKAKFFNCLHFNTSIIYDPETGADIGGGTATVTHNLGSVPGMIIVRELSGSTWYVYHRSLDANRYLEFDSTSGSIGGNKIFSVTSTQFSVEGLNWGRTCLAYVFAHDAGGFGDSGTDSIIKCGSYTGNGSSSGPTIELGWEPQFIMIKRDGTGNWVTFDSVRGIASTAAGIGNPVDYFIAPNRTDIENTSGNYIDLRSTGFSIKTSTGDVNISGDTYYYMAIRRGDMRIPTKGSNVFVPVTYSGTNVDNRLVTTGITTDMTMARIRNTLSGGSFFVADRLRGNNYIATGNTSSEATDADSFMSPTTTYGNAFSTSVGFGVGNDPTRLLNGSSTPQLAYAFKRARGFFDQVIYQGTGAYPLVVNHNLGVAPELMIFRRLNYDGVAPFGWRVFHKSAVTPNANWYQNYIELNNNATTISDTSTFTVAPTSTSLTISGNLGANGAVWVVYLFASVPKVSSIGSYVGNGTSQNINCGFDSQLSFVLIKHIGNGNWVVFDKARGITSGIDPYLLINNNAAEIDTIDAIDSDVPGFLVEETTGPNINTNGQTYIYFAIAT